jgi:hypothetical protein
VSSILPPETDSNKTPRKAISRRLRFEILRRDSNTCRYCHATDTPLVIDHVLPVALGGTDDPSNLVAACKDCNAGKTSTSPDAALVAQVDEDAVRWAAAMRLARDRALAAREAREQELAPLFDCWYHFVPSYKIGDWRWELPSNWAEVVGGLLDAGLSAVLMGDAMRIALTTRGVDDRFRYFCGIARNRLAELQAEAATLIADGAV